MKIEKPQPLEIKSEYINAYLDNSRNNSNFATNISKLPDNFKEGNSYDLKVAMIGPKMLLNPKHSRMSSNTSI